MMNQHSPGPARATTSGPRGTAIETDAGEYIGMSNTDQGIDDKANAALLAAAYTAFDAAGRELGVDAAELAKSIDLAEVIRYALDYAQLNTTAHDLKNVGRVDQTDHARRTLAPLAKLMQVKLPL